MTEPDKKGHYSSWSACGCWTNETGSFYCTDHNKKFKEMKSTILNSALDILSAFNSGMDQR